jgi:hypothetical protein
MFSSKVICSAREGCRRRKIKAKTAGIQIKMGIKFLGSLLRAVNSTVGQTMIENTLVYEKTICSNYQKGAGEKIEEEETSALEPHNPENWLYAVCSISRIS